MPRPQDDDVARGSTSSGRPAAGRPDAAGFMTARNLLQAAGFVLAVAATLAVFLTDNRQYLRIAVVAVAWAFVLATFAAGRRGADRATAAAREAHLRHTYDLELEREVAARREYELDLEHDLRRESEDAMRDELDALRGEIASLGQLRAEVARVSDLRHDLAGLAAMRDDVARVAALRDDVAALTSLRADLGQLAELRDDMSRLRAELTEQLSSELLVERIVMRTQGRWQPADQGRPDASVDVARWVDDAPPRELTGGWPAIRLDEHRELRQPEPVRAEESGRHTPAAPVWPTGPGTSTFSSVAPPPPPTGSWSSLDRPVPPSTEDSWADRSRHSGDQPDAMSPPTHRSVPPPVPPAQVPLSPSTALRPAVAPRPSPRPRPTPPVATGSSVPEFPPVRRRSEDAETAHTAERPSVASGPPPEMPAETGEGPSTGGRRRRRYREDGESDDVLARVLGLS